MGENKRQHYVNQAYQKRFSPNGRRVFVFDKVLGKSFPDGIRNIAQESHFYTVPIGADDQHGAPMDFDPLFVEKWLQRMEGDFEKDIRILIDLPLGGKIDSDTRINLSLWLALQSLRTRAYRNLVVEMTEQLVDAINKKAIRLNFGENAVKYAPKVTYTEDAAALFQSEQFLDGELLGVIGEILFQHIWTVLVNETDHPFYTSDHPVVLHRHGPGRGVGFASRGVEIAYPLSSTRLLSLVDREMLGDQADRFDSRVRTVSAENVEFYNSLQVLHSERQVYCEKSDFALAEDMLKKNPKLSMPGRPRIQVD